MYCPQCGTELPEGSKFCPKCGTATNFSTVPSKQATVETHENSKGALPANQDSAPMPSEEVRCPKCGASGCVPQYKQNVSGGGYGCLQGGLGALILGPFGLLCGLCGRSTTTTNTLMWVCPKCGHEFVSRKNLFESLIILLWSCSVFIIGIAFVLGAAIKYGLDSALSLILLILGGCSGFLVWVIYQGLHNYSGTASKELLTEQEKKTVNTHILIAGCIAAAAFVFSLLA